MNRSELVRAVAERAGSDETVARRHVDAVVETVMERVSAGERVTVTGFGTFDRLSRPARSARNPRTGVPVEVPAADVPRFRSGQTFRNRVAHGDSAPAEAPVAAPAEAPAAVPAAVETAPADPSDAVAAEPPSPKKSKAPKGGKSAKSGAKNAEDGAKNGRPGKSGKNQKKAKKGADATKKTSKKAKAIKMDIPAPAKKKPRKAKARAKAAK